MLVREQLLTREHFSELDCRIADYILERQEGLGEDSIRQLAKRLYVAPSSVVRFCQRLGFQGFNEFRDAYLAELRYLSSHFQELDPNFPFGAGDKDLVVANKIGTLYQEIIQDCQSLLDGEAVRAAVDMLEKAANIYICAAGAQLGVAEVFKDKMMKIGKLVHICTQTDEAYYHASYCGRDSLFLIVSYTGETRRVLRAGQKLREREIPAVAITSYGNNTLSSLCACSLYVSTREKLIKNLGTFGINLSAMYLLDVLYAGCFNRDPERHYADKVKHSSECEESGTYKGRHSRNPILEG